MAPCLGSFRVGPASASHRPLSRYLSACTRPPLGQARRNCGWTGLSPPLPGRCVALRVHAAFWPLADPWCQLWFCRSPGLSCLCAQLKLQPNNSLTACLMVVIPSVQMRTPARRREAFTPRLHCQSQSHYLSVKRCSPSFQVGWCGFRS